MSTVIDKAKGSIDVGARDGCVYFETEGACNHDVTSSHVFALTPEEAVQLSRALVKAAGEALGVKKGEL